MIYIAAVLLALAGLAIGAELPDIDQKLPFLLHRSILTHSVFLPLLLYLPLRRKSNLAIRYFVIGVCVALAVHFSFDLFPRAWTGYALISIPLYGRTTPVFSWIWLVITILVCLDLACTMLETWIDLAISAGAMLLVFALSAPGEQALMRPLLVMIATGALAFLFAPIGDDLRRKLVGRVQGTSSPLDLDMDETWVLLAIGVPVGLLLIASVLVWWVRLWQ